MISQTAHMIFSEMGDCLGAFAQLWELYKVNLSYFLSYYVEVQQDESNRMVLQCVSSSSGGNQSARHFMANFSMKHPLCLWNHPSGLTQFDLSEKELEHLRSRRWHFSTPSTALPQSKSEPTMATRGEDRRLTVGDVFRRLSLSINIQPPTNPGT